MKIKKTNVDWNKKVIFQDAVHNRNENFLKSDRLSVVGKFELWQKIQSGLLTFFHETTIHGIVYLARRRLHIIER